MACTVQHKPANILPSSHKVNSVLTSFSHFTFQRFSCSEAKGPLWVRNDRPLTSLWNTGLKSVTTGVGDKAIKKFTCLALVEVVEDFTTQVLFALPLALTGIVEEIPQGPVLPLQQLPVQQQGERCLCCRGGGGVTGQKVSKVKVYHHDYLLSSKATDVEQFAQSGRSDELIPSRHFGPSFCEQMACDTKRSQWHKAQVAQSTVSMFWYISGQRCKEHLHS